MSKIPMIYRKLCAVICALLLIVSQLTGCTKPTDDANEVPPVSSEDTVQTENNVENTQDTEEVTDSDEAEFVDDTDDAKDAEDAEGASLVSLRQAMIETPQIFAAAFFGHAERGADVFALMQENAPQLCENLPFLLNIRAENIIGDIGYLFCIVPADENATVAVNRRLWNDESGAYEEAEVLYRSENGEPILVLYPNENGMSDTELVITDSNGNIAVWYPDSSYSVAPLFDDNGESRIFDFTSYDELPAPSSNSKIDCYELVGTWEQIWTEVEGDRNETAPGVCTIEITADETGFFRISYSDTEFPEYNFSDRELIVVPGELYPGCGNDDWLAEVSEAEGDTTWYALALLKDGSLLMQQSWEMDGMLWVSYCGYEKIG